MRHTPSVSSRRATAASPSSCSVSTSRSASSGGSYGRVDAGEAGQLARAGPRVQALRVAPLALLDRRVDEDLDERRARPRSCSSRASSRSAAIGETSETSATTPASANSRATWATRRMFSLRSPGVEAEVAGQPVADVVAVEQVGGAAGLDQRALERDGDRRLARGRQAGEPDRRAARAERAPALLAVELGVVPGDVAACRPRPGGARAPASTMPAPTVSLRVLVDQDERARGAVVGVGVGEHRRARAQRDAADVVELELGPARARRSSVVMSSRAEHGLDRRPHRARRVLERVAGAGAQRRVGHPARPSPRARAPRPARRRAREIRSPRPTSRSSASRTATDIGGNARSSGPSSVLDRLDRRARARGQHDHLVARRAARRRRAGPRSRARRRGRRAGGSSTAPGSAASSRLRSARDLDRLEVLEQRRPVVPGRGVASGRRRCRRAARRSGSRARRRRSSRSASVAELAPRSRGSAPRPSRRGPSCSRTRPGGGCRAAPTGRRGGATARRGRCARRSGPARGRRSTRR